MDEKCPGQESRNLHVLLLKCPRCANEVEIFSDEAKTRCRRCGEIIYHEQTPTVTTK